jgi:hypothetical protein
VIGAVNNFSAAKDIVVCAAGSLPADLHKLWRTQDSKGFHMEYGYSCMGYEIAGGLGVKMAVRFPPHCHGRKCQSTLQKTVALCHPFLQIGFADIRWLPVLRLIFLFGLPFFCSLQLIGDQIFFISYY